LLYDLDTMPRHMDPSAGSRPPAVRMGRNVLRCAGVGAYVAAASLLVVAQPHMESAAIPVPFSSGTPGSVFPRGWEPVQLSDRKHPTAYALVADGDSVVLHAQATAAASGLAQFFRFDI